MYQNELKTCIQKERYGDFMYQAKETRYDRMKYQRCGNSGLMLPKVSLGFWHNLGDTGVYENMRQMVFTAFDNGITHFDLANNYGPECGKVLTATGTAGSICWQA